MKLLKSVIATVLPLCCATPSLSEDYAKVGNWSISRSERDTCYALNSIGEMATAVEYDAKSGHVWLRLINDNATSIAEGQTVKLRIEFTRGNRLDDGWGEQDFTVFISNGTRVLNSGSFNTEMLDDFAKNDYFIAEYDEKLVSGAKLTDSAAMVAKLRNCSVEAAGLNPKDPFIP